MSDDLAQRMEAAIGEANQASADFAELRQEFKRRGADIQNRLLNSLGSIEMLLTIAKRNADAAIAKAKGEAR
jgi:hypothetical protein